MTTRARVLVLVNDLEATLNFYTNVLNWTLGECPTPDTAFILDPSGEAILLASLEAGDTTPYVQENALTKQSGSTLQFRVANADDLRAELEQRGLQNLRIERGMWEHTLYVPVPEHTLLFLAPAPLSTQELLARYKQEPYELDSVLAGKSEADLDIARAPGEWTVRQIVHHISDGDDLWAMVIKAALAASGASYNQEWYSTDNACFEPLDYAGRSIEPALALFRATRAHIVQLLSHLPADAWERYVMLKIQGMPTPVKMTVALAVMIQAKHALEHIDEIREIYTTSPRKP